MGWNGGPNQNCDYCGAPLGYFGNQSHICFRCKKQGCDNCQTRIVKDEHMTCHYVHVNNCVPNSITIRTAMSMMHRAFMAPSLYLSKLAFDRVMVIINARQTDLEDELTKQMLIDLLMSTYPDYFSRTKKNDDKYIQLSFDDCDGYFTLQLFNKSGSHGGCYIIYIYDLEKKRKLLPSEMANKIIAIAEDKLVTQNRARTG